MKILFLGTGGGRYTTISQARHTGGIIIVTDKEQIHIDPGPGALVREIENNIDPMKTSILYVSHQHIDHSNDANIIIEGMSEATRKKKGTVICSKGVFNEIISEYHKNLVKEVIVIEEGKKIEVKGIVFEGTRCKHTEPEAVGVKIDDKKYKIVYTSDSYVYDGFEKTISGVDAVIANVILPGKWNLKHHMCSKDFIEAVNKCDLKPKLIIITHFDVKMLKYGAEKIAKEIENKTGVKTIAAEDNMSIDLSYLINKRT